MLRHKRTLMVGLGLGLMVLLATPAFARSISMKEAGSALWIFAFIGAIIILLQLVPAMILFFSFIGTATTIAFKKEKKSEEEALLPGVAPMPIKK